MGIEEVLKEGWFNDESDGGINRVVKDDGKLFLELLVDTEPGSSPPRKWKRVREMHPGELSIYCTYCKALATSIASAEEVKRHLESCPKHPMHTLKQENEVLKQRIAQLEEERRTR